MSNIKNNFSELFHDTQEVTVPMFADDTPLVCLARTKKELQKIKQTIVRQKFNLDARK